MVLLLFSCVILTQTIKVYFKTGKNIYVSINLKEEQLSIVKLGLFFKETYAMDDKFKILFKSLKKREIQNLVHRNARFLLI